MARAWYRCECGKSVEVRARNSTDAERRVAYAIANNFTCRVCSEKYARHASRGPKVTDIPAKSKYYPIYIVADESGLLCEFQTPYDAGDHARKIKSIVTMAPRDHDLEKEKCTPEMIARLDRLFATFSCGHLADRRIYSPHWATQNALKTRPLAGLCPDCHKLPENVEQRAAEFKARADEAARISSDLGFRELFGSDLQIRRATVLRLDYYKKSDTAQRKVIWRQKKAVWFLTRHREIDEFCRHNEDKPIIEKTVGQSNLKKRNNEIIRLVRAGHKRSDVANTFKMTTQNVSLIMQKYSSDQGELPVSNT